MILEIALGILLAIVILYVAVVAFFLACRFRKAIFATFSGLAVIGLIVYAAVIPEYRGKLIAVVAVFALIAVMLLHKTPAMKAAEQSSKEKQAADALFWQEIAKDEPDQNILDDAMRTCEEHEPQQPPAV